MGPLAAIAAGAAFGFLYLVPLALFYLGLVQSERHYPSGLALHAAGGAIFGRTLATGPGFTDALVTMHLLAILPLAGLALAALGLKLALRRRPGFRDGETLAERLLPLLIVGDLILVLLSWPTIASAV